MRYLLLSGMSGAGKTVALRYLEDCGVFCVDNLPPNMLVSFMESCEKLSSHFAVTALAVDVRSWAFFGAHEVRDLLLEASSLGYQLEILFLEAGDDTLVSRYKESRREHPLAGSRVSLTEAIAKERSMLQPLRESADYLIDTTNLKPKGLQKQLDTILRSVGEEEHAPIRVEVLSFGFKRGLPRAADLVFDVRFLPNPFYIPELCRHSGMDEDVRKYVMEHAVTKEFMERTTGLLDFLLPHYVEEGKHRLVIAIGCTGGAHRSVAIAEAIGHDLQDKGYLTSITHRDVDIEQAHWLGEMD